MLPAKIVFMGTPDFAVPALTALISASTHEQWQVAGVVTQPDRPQGRGKKLTPPPVKVAAAEAGLKILQPETLKAEAAYQELAALQPDVIVLAAFGQILRQNVLDLPSHGCINIHASLLPRWRGAAPVAAAIRAGDAQTGVTIMQMDAGLDTGPMLAKRAITIKPTHTTGILTAELAQLGADLLIETLPAWLKGELQAQPQDDALATLAPRLKKKDGYINWSQPAVEIERQIRAFQPWPSAFTQGPRGQFKILAAEVSSQVQAPPAAGLGMVFEHQRGVYVTTGQGTLRLVTTQPAGKKAMTAEAMLNGQPELWGARLG